MTLMFFNPFGRALAGDLTFPLPPGSTVSGYALDVNGALVEVFDCLMANDFRRVLVEEDGKLAGVISRSDLMPTILSVLAERG